MARRALLRAGRAFLEEYVATCRRVPGEETDLEVQLCAGAYARLCQPTITDVMPLEVVMRPAVDGALPQARGFADFAFVPLVGHVRVHMEGRAAGPALFDGVLAGSRERYEEQTLVTRCLVPGGAGVGFLLRTDADETRLVGVSLSMEPMMINVAPPVWLRTLVGACTALPGCPRALRALADDVERHYAAVTAARPAGPAPPRRPAEMHHPAPADSSANSTSCAMM